MAITLYYRNTTGHVGTLGTTGNFDLETTTGTTATQAFSANAVRTFVYYSAANFPNKTDWETGDYTWYLDVTTANANVQLTSVKVSRYNSALNSELASGTATPNLTLSTTGLKTGTVSFASPNPGGRSASDRLVITLSFTKLAGGGTQSVNGDVNGSGDSRIDTPLIIPVVRDISEGSVSVSEAVETQELYTKPISEDSVSASDSIEGTKIPAGPENEFYSVHLVEFPEEVSDSVYVPAPQQVEQVSTTKTHKYNLIGKVTTTKTHKYNVIGLVTQTKTHKFNIIQKITQTKTHKFNVIAKITATKTHLFSVLQQIVQTKTHKYNIIQQILRTRTHKFDVASSIIEVTTTKTHKFNITSPFEPVSTTKTHKYNVIAKVTKTKTHVFSVLQRVLPTKTHKYNVLQRVLNTKTHIYSVIARVLTQKTHIYSVIQQILRTRTHKYNVAGRIFATKTHKFNIITKITQTKTHKYNILLAVSTATKTHKFNISQLAARTRTHKFNIVGRITRTRTHRYQMGGRVLVSKIHKFVVGYGGTLQELGGSTNAYVRFQDRVQIIDIIADLNNLAIANVEIPVSRPPANIATATVAIAEYIKKTEGGFLLPRTASTEQILLHRLESQQILPPIIEAIENRAKCDHIAIEILPLNKLTLLVYSHTAIAKLAKSILVGQTQLIQSEKTKIRFASATMLQQTQETMVESKAQLEMLVIPKPIVAPEIMTRQKAKTLKTLINLLSSDHLFGS